MRSSRNAASAGAGWGRMTAGANGERTTECWMRATSVCACVCERRAKRRSSARPTVDACQPVRSNAPSAATSAATTTRPDVVASFRPLASTIAPRGPIRSTVRNAWLDATAEYSCPCSTCTDQARISSRPSAMATSTPRPPIRMKKPGLRKYGASAREYGSGLRLPGSERGRVIRRRGCGVEIETAGLRLVGELVGQQGQSQRSPGRLRIGAERLHGLGDSRQAARVECGERRVELLPPLRRVELGGEPLGGDGVRLEVAVRVAAGRQHEHRPAAGRVQLLLVEADVVADEPRDRDAEVEVGGL